MKGSQSVKLSMNQAVVVFILYRTVHNVCHHLSIQIFMLICIFSMFKITCLLLLNIKKSIDFKYMVFCKLIVTSLVIACRFIGNCYQFDRIFK